MGDRSEYQSILPQVSPAQAVDILNDRVRHVGRLNISIADWLQVRDTHDARMIAAAETIKRKEGDWKSSTRQH